MTKLIAVLTLLALVQDDPVVAAALRGFSHPWSGFHEGSTITCVETSKRPEVDDSGNLVLKDVPVKVVWTMGNVDRDKATIRIESEGRESEVPHHFVLPNWARGKGERKADEEIAVGERKFACRVTTIAVDPDKEASELTTIWQSAQAPGWAVKIRNETLARGHPNTWEESVLTALDEKMKVGDGEVACQVVLVTSGVENGNKVVKKEWRSEEVPGRVVRRETRHYGKDGREIQAAFSQMDVVSFKPRK